MTFFEFNVKVLCCNVADTLPVDQGTIYYYYQIAIGTRGPRRYNRDGYAKTTAFCVIINTTNARGFYRSKSDVNLYLHFVSDVVWKVPTRISEEANISSRFF